MENNKIYFSDKTMNFHTYEQKKTHLLQPTHNMCKKCIICKIN